jgi:hypothetical protein
MRSECMAAMPQFLCSYAWKVPPARPALFERAQALLSGGEEKAGHDAHQGEHASIPWKAYLASREFQHLASNLAEAFFAEPSSAGSTNAARPACLTSSAAALPEAGAEPPRGLLKPVLAEGVQPAWAEPGYGEPQHDIALAA